MRKPAYSLRLATYSFLAVGCWLLAVSFAWADGIAIDPSRTLLGARQIALGRSGAAIDSDPWSLFINPSGLADIEYPKATATSRKVFFNETQYLCLGLAVPTDSGTWGIGIIDANIANSYQTRRDGETNRIIPNPSKEAISYDNNVIFLSYSKKKFLRDRLSAGANLKIYRQGFYGGSAANASAYGLDIGAQYQIFPYLRVGGNYQNFLSSSLKWSSSGEAENSLGGNIKVGTMVNILGKKESALRENEQELNGIFDINIPREALNNNMSYNLGLEWQAAKDISLRAGYDSAWGLSYGVGLKNWGFRFDYAYAASPYGQGDNPHYFTLSYLGDYLKVVSRKLLKEKIALNFHKYRDKSVTVHETIIISGEAVYDKVYDKITSWVVPSIEQKDQHELVTEEANLLNVKINNKPLQVTGSFEAEESLSLGRNIFYIQGDIPGKGTTYETVRILRVIPFEDVPETHWAFEPIAINSTLEILKGYPGNLFKPEAGISRAELVALLLRTKNILPEESLENPFKDLKADFWATPFVLKGVEMKLVTGYPDGTFKPQKALSRAEGITIISRFAGLAASSEAKSSFPDLKEDFWANKFITPAKEAGLLNYLAGKEFNPDAAFTRAEAAEVLSQTKEIKTKEDYFWEIGKISEAPTAEAVSQPVNSPSPDKNTKP